MDNISYYFDLMMAIGFIVIGIVFTFLNVQNLRQNNYLQKNGIATTGKIVAIEEVEDEGILYRPILECRTFRNETIKEKLDGRNPNSLEIGQEVEVFYDAEIPTEFIINTDYEMKYKNYIFILVGIFFLIAGICKYLNFINI